MSCLTNAPPYEHITTVEELATVVERLSQASHVGIAIETTGPDPFTDRIRTIQFAASGMPVPVIEWDRLSHDALLRELLNTPTLKVVHDGKALLKFLRRADINLAPPFFDTMLASQLLKGGLDAAHDLHTMARVYLGWAPDLRADFRAAVLGPAHLGCATRRAQTILALHGVLRARLAEAGLAESMDLECRCLPAVAAMEFAGMPIDGERWEEVRHAYDALAGEAAYEVCSRLSLPGQRTLSGVAAINLNSPRQVRDAFRAVGMAPREARGRTNSSRTKEVHPAIPPYLRYRHLAKLKNGFLDAFPRHAHPVTGRIHPTLQVGTVNGRFACRDPNLQQVPRDDMIRGCFVASHGHRLVIADYAQFELRVIADISGDATMTRAFQRGEDVHRLTASLILDVPLDAVTKDERLIAKVLNIGLIYGMGAGACAATPITSMGCS